MQSILIKNLSYSAFFITLGIVIPIIFHTVGMGSVFLPMYLPLTVGSFFLLPRWAFTTGILTPSLSFILTGMPPVSPPILPVMIAELSILTFIISLLNNKSKLGVIWILVIGLIFSRIIVILSAWILSPVIGLPPKLISFAVVVHSLPGIVIILVFVPLFLNKISNILPRSGR